MMSVPERLKRSVRLSFGEVKYFSTFCLLDLASIHNNCVRLSETLSLFLTLFKLVPFSSFLRYLRMTVQESY